MASSFAWSSLENGGAQLAQVVVFFVAARILSPEEVGHASLALILTQAFQGIIATSINGYIVSVSEERLIAGASCAFWIAVGIGGIQLLLTATGAGAYLVLGGKPHFALLYVIASTTNFVMSLGIVHQALMTRALAMRSLMIRTLTSVILAGCCGIGLAILGFGAYAIVLQSLLQATIGTTLLWYFSPWRPAWRVNSRGLRDIFDFSRHMFVTGLLNFMVGNADLAIVGAFLGGHAAGVYAVSRRALFAFNGLITTALSQVSLSVFAQLRELGRGELERRFLTIIGLTSMVTVPLFFALSGLSRPLVMILFGQKWIEAAPVMAVLMPFGALQSLGVYNQSFVIVLGRPDLQTRLSFIYAVVTIPLLALSAQFSVLSVAVAYTLRGYLTFPMSMALVTGRSAISRWRYLEVVAPAFVCGMLVGCATWGGQRFAAPSPVWQIFAGCSASLIVYALWLSVFARNRFRQLHGLILR